MSMTKTNQIWIKVTRVADWLLDEKDIDGGTFYAIMKKESDSGKAVQIVEPSWLLPNPNAMDKVEWYPKSAIDYIEMTFEEIITETPAVKKFFDEFNVEVEALKAEAKEKKEARKALENSVKKMEKIKTMITEPYGDGSGYHEVEIEKNAWMCAECGLVWAMQGDAKGCRARGHKKTFKRTYGGRFVNGQHVGGTAYTTYSLYKGEVEPVKKNPEPVVTDTHIDGKEITCECENYQCTKGTEACEVSQ